MECVNCFGFSYWCLRSDNKQCEGIRHHLSQGNFSFSYRCLRSDNNQCQRIHPDLWEGAERIVGDFSLWFDLMYSLNLFLYWFLQFQEKDHLSTRDHDTSTMEFDNMGGSCSLKKWKKEKKQGRTCYSKHESFEGSSVFMNHRYVLQFVNLMGYTFPFTSPSQSVKQ